MEFTWLRFHETVFKEIKKNFYIGLGYHLDSHSSIVDKNLDVAAGKFTSHYNYSINNGFSPTQYNLSGLSLNYYLTTDRDKIRSNHIKECTSTSKTGIAQSFLEVLNSVT